MWIFIFCFLIFWKPNSISIICIVIRTLGVGSTSLYTKNYRNTEKTVEGSRDTDYWIFIFDSLKIWKRECITHTLYDFCIHRNLEWGFISLCTKNLGNVEKIVEGKLEYRFFEFLLLFFVNRELYTARIAEIRSWCRFTPVCVICAQWGCSFEDLGFRKAR